MAKFNLPNLPVPAPLPIVEPIVEPVVAPVVDSQWKNKAKVLIILVCAIVLPMIGTFLITKATYNNSNELKQYTQQVTELQKEMSSLREHNSSLQSYEINKLTAVINGHLTDYNNKKTELLNDPVLSAPIKKMKDIDNTIIKCILQLNQLKGITNLSSLDGISLITSLKKEYVIE